MKKSSVAGTSHWGVGMAARLGIFTSDYRNYRELSFGFEVLYNKKKCLYYILLYKKVFPFNLFPVKKIVFTFMFKGVVHPNLIIFQISPNFYPVASLPTQLSCVTAHN